MNKHIGQPANRRNISQSGREQLLGEDLTNLYTGMAREKRSERLLAMRLLRCHAVDGMLEQLKFLARATAASRDELAIGR